MGPVLVLCQTGLSLLYILQSVATISALSVDLSISNISRQIIENLHFILLKLCVSLFKFHFVLSKLP